ncbi:DUF4268 domain-containing protein [Mucilaginibacter polytrichastri]|uniref:DUF4268 domain-containing protein n=1 Tax=Mucilaginibacter polytrichastri TaxID=1302689 RepID=A0A1Q6A5D2_9SPHI|nr:DUF4268 domain-containing protein [Mucilaginibacter polytrichastri]OKS89206.1 hypothetical protein RG47T_4688 [Mucilaginibacter polytrichastri]SFS97992.1 protein of unknown function [Mucilaginibacter polytrichastri]
MYSKDQASQLKQAFWTAFGQYISPQLSAEGLKINWVNYKTGIKHLYFRMQADKHSASIAIEIAHPDAGIQELFFEQFKEFKNILHSALNEEWEWQLHTTDEYGKTISRIYKEISPVNVFDNNDWPQLISFLKPRIIALDEFWSDGKYGFDALK